MAWVTVETDPLMEDGAEYSLDFPEGWDSLAPGLGDILEVFIAGTDHLSALKLWAGFLVMEVNASAMGTTMFRVKFLGVADAELSKEFSNKFNRKTGYLHLCRSRPCIEDDDSITLHTTQLRWWSNEGFQADYMTPAVRRQMKKWLEAAGKGTELPPSKPAIFGATPKSSAAKGAGLDEYEPEFIPTAPPGDPPDEFLRPPEDGRREALRARLRGVREKLAPGAGGQTSKPDPPGALGGTGKGPRPEPSHKPLAALEMNTGSTLPPLAGYPSGSRAPGVTSGVSLKQSHRPEEALVAQAVAIYSSRKESKKKKKKKKKRDPASRMASIFKEAFNRKKRKKGRKRKKSPGGSSPSSPGSSKDSYSYRKRGRKRKTMTQPDGTIVSCSTSCSSNSDTDAESSSTELEAPLRKKSAKHPGSILALLVNHVRSQLSQSSLLDLDPNADSVTQGVKITSYFSLNIRGTFPTATRELREMFTLARALDTIRAGDVARASDQLAGRFIALHQALLDGGWSTARHMELSPLEDSNAASPAMVLATRRHSKLYQRMQGNDFGGGGNFGSGRGKGRRQWSSWGAEPDRGDGGWKGKNKGGKGKGKNQDGRNKGKGTGSPNNSWATNLEKAEDKTPK